MHAPEGYTPLDRSAPFWDLVGPFYQKECNGTRYLGLRVEEKHCNIRGVVQGGVICTLADVALGLNIAAALPEPAPIATVNLTTDYAGAGQLGDWLETRVDVQRTGRRLAFANAYIFVGEQRIARISGVFTVLS